MKRIIALCSTVVALAGVGASAASAQSTNVGVQIASITQTSAAVAPAVQLGNGGLFNNNSSSATSANYAAIVQGLTQFNF